MDTSGIILIMLIVCGVLTAVVVLAGPLKICLKIIINSALGTAAMFCINTFLGGLGLFVGINPATVIAVGLLGIPGLAAMYIIQIILR